MYIEVRIWRIRFQISLHFLEEEEEEDPIPPHHKAGFQPNE